MVNRTLNISPKVAVPGFVGSVTAAVVCNLHHYGINVDVGSAASGIVTIMILLGWIVPTDNAAAIASKNNGNGVQPNEIIP